MMDFRFLFERLPDGAQSARPWNGNDAKGHRTHHGYVPKKSDPKDIPLYWRTETNAPARYIGAYRLSLAELFNAGYIRAERNGFRVRFVHAEDGCIYLQKDRRSNRLLVGVFQ